MDKEEEIEEKKEKTKSKRNKRRASRNNTQTEAKRMKVTIGKKAAEKKRSRNATKKQIIEKETELDYDESSEEDIEEGKKKKLLEEDKKIWTKGGWNVNPKERDTLRSKLIGEIGDLFEDDSLIDYFLMYLPIQYIKEEVIPATNAAAKLIDPDYEEFTFNEFIQILGIMYSMEVIRLPERRLYWSTTAEGLLPVFNFGRFVTLDRFEEFLNYWALSGDEDRNEQVLKFIDAVNAHLKNTLQPGEDICIDESMIKAYHKNLAGKMKIIRKPRPIGNELKTVGDSKTQICIHMEMHEAKEDMEDKEYRAEYGATTSCVLRITKHYAGSGRTIIGDSWFGSVNSCCKLWSVNGLRSIFLVKTAHKKYPRHLLRETAISRGEWTSATAEIEGQKLLAVRFLDLKEKQFITNASTSLPGIPRETKHHGKVARPMCAYQYLQSSAGIDIHNHYRTGSCGLEDVWKTHNTMHRQVAGVLGFLFTNAFLTKKYFQKSDMRHYVFKLKLANLMVEFDESKRRMRRLQIEIGMPATSDIHLPKLLKETRYQEVCWYCRHNPKKPPAKPPVKTSFCCDTCGTAYPLCHPHTGRSCFRDHIEYGMPVKRRYLKPTRKVGY